MRTPVPNLGGELARRWRRATVPWWVFRFVLPAWWLATMVWVLVGAGSGPSECSAADPSICGPDYAFAVHACLFLLTPVFLLWMPLVGCSLGMVAGVLDVAFDADPTANLAFGAFAVGCAAVAAWSASAAGHRRVIAAEAGVGYRAVLEARHRGPDFDDRHLFRVVGMALVGAVLFTWFGVAQGIERAHLSQAHVAQASVLSYDADLGTVDLRLGDRSFADVDVYGEYEEGASVPVRVDPEDASWVRLVAEPYDGTGWFAAGLGALILAAGMVRQDLLGRRRATPRHRFRTVTTSRT